MGFLSKLFGGSFEDHKTRADALYAEGDFGGAKLAYEKALDKAASQPEDVRKALARRIDESCDGIARARLEEGTRLAENGDLDLARTELHGAVEVAASAEVRAEAQAVLDGLERDDAVAQAGPVAEVTDEDLLAVLMGSWEQPQAEEYEEYGAPLYDALVAVQRERFAEARELLEGLAEEAEDPRYLWLEIGRVRLLTDDAEGGAEALETFLETLLDGEGGDARLAAYVELARIADDAGDFEGAMDQFQRALEAFDQDFRPYYVMGHFLRTRGHPEEAVEVLTAAADVMDEMRPDWRVLADLGLAQAEAEHEDDAVATLESVVDLLSGLGIRDLPREPAMKLAELHEKRGNPSRAADLFRVLADGSDREHKVEYHREAARLLRVVGLADEAHRLLQRAVALAGDDAEQVAAIEAQLAEVDAGT